MKTYRNGSYQIQMGNDSAIFAKIHRKAFITGRYTQSNRMIAPILATWLGLVASAVWADELPLPILLANDPTADYSTDQPAVVLLQDWQLEDASQTALTDWVRDSFGTEFSFVRDDKSSYPSGVISRFSIAQHGIWEPVAPPASDGSGRSLWARIDLPGKTDLWVVNTRLTMDPDGRYEQVKDLVARILTEVPDEDYLIVGGELNLTDNPDPSLEVLGTVLDIEIIKQPEGDVYDWLFSDAELTEHREADDPQAKFIQKASLNRDEIHRELYRLLKSFRVIDLADYFQQPAVTLENGVNAEGIVSPVLFRNRHEYRLTPAGPGTRSLEVVMESTGPGDADLQLAYWDTQLNGWIFYANQATAGTSDERVSISQRHLLNREWRIIVEYSAGSTAPYRLRAVEVVDLQALHSILHPLPPGPPATPQANLSAPWQNAPAGGWRFYALDVPINAANVLLEVERTSGPEVHVYVQKDSTPWFNNHVLTSQSSNIIHTLSISTTSTPPLSTGVWYFGVYAPGPQAADYDLTADLSCCAGPPPVSGTIPLSNTLAQPGAVWFDDWQYYVLDLPVNATRLNIALNPNGLGDADLYYGGNSQPTLSSTGSRTRGSSQEQLTLNFSATSVPTPSPYPVHIGVYGYSAGGYELTATWSDSFFTQTLPNGGREFLLQNFPVYDNQPVHFAIQVPSTPAYSALNITALSQDDATLLVRQDTPPDKYNYDFSMSTLSGSNVMISSSTVPSLTPGTWWFALYSNAPRSDMIELRAELQP